MPLVRAVANRVVAVFLVVMGVVLIGEALALWEQRQSTLEFVRCTSQWQSDFLAAYEARISAATAVSNATDDVIHSVADPNPADRARAFRRALRHYESVRTDQNHQRLAHPPPPPPSVVCGS